MVSTELKRRIVNGALGSDSHRMAVQAAIEEVEQQEGFGQ